MQALRNIYCAIAAIAIKHMCALSELNVLDFISQVKTLLMKNKQNNYDINKSIWFFINLCLYLYLFKVQFNNSVPIIENISETGYAYIFIMGETQRQHVINNLIGLLKRDVILLVKK